MESGVIIRPAGIDDADAIRRLLIEFGYAADDLAHVDERLRESELGTGPYVFVCERSGEVIALASLNISRVLERPAPQGRVSILVVRGAERGQGVGRALVERLESVARDTGCSRLELTSAYSLRGARAFWPALGYTETGIRFARTLGAESVWPSQSYESI